MNAASNWNGQNLGPDPSAGAKKGVDAYVKALWRRCWVVLLITLLVGVGGTIFTLNQKPVYAASARVQIDPPKSLMHIGDNRGQQMNNFFRTRLEMITSRIIVDRVLKSIKDGTWSELNGVADPVGTLVGWIRAKPVKDSNLVDVSIEGRDPKLVAEFINRLVEEFKRYEEQLLQKEENATRLKLRQEITSLETQRSSSDSALADFYKQNEGFLFTDANLEAEKLSLLEQSKAQAEIKLDAAKQMIKQFQEMIKEGTPYLAEGSTRRVLELRERLNQYDEELQRFRERFKPQAYERDAFVRKMREERQKVEDEINGLGKEDAQEEIKRLEQQVMLAELDVKRLSNFADEQRKKLLGEQSNFKTLQTLRDEKVRLDDYLNFLKREDWRNNVNLGLTEARIEIIDRAEEPRVPVRPQKALQIGLFIVGGMLLGCMLVLGLEHMDHSIRDPEQAIASLDCPLLGVVPRIHTRELTTTSGRLILASELPGSQVCEAFRNLRMGILGAESKQPLRLLLVASAKAGEGKSLVAANLAATCARAGESVCLIDMDLRKPSVQQYFDIPARAPGLTDALEGNAPWPNATVETEIPNLSVIPTGIAEGVPLDILGTVEMHDLLAELVEKYDRVILDAPPLLGLADARAVGRFADGLLLVVQAGTHDGKPLARVRQLMDQEGLRPIGLVFNGLRDNHDDLANYPTNPGKSRAGRTANKSTKAAKVA